MRPSARKEKLKRYYITSIMTIEPGAIVFTKEDQEDDVLPVLDSKLLIVDRKTKRIMYFVHYKKTPTNMKVKKRSNHPKSMKNAIIKDSADRARTLCDEKHLAEELHNFEYVFVANGYPGETVRRFMEQRPQQIDKREQGEQESRDRDHSILKSGCLSSSGELLTETLFELLSNLEERLKRLNVHVKSRLVKGRNALYIRFLVPVRILYM